MNTLTKKSLGFTLVELLVVIAIIGLLASIILVSLSSAKAKGRDARRISDLKQLQLALELYYDANSVFPATLSALTGPGYIATIPTDPMGGTQYTYVPYTSSAATPACISYHLGTSLESNDPSTLSTGVYTMTGYNICTGGLSTDGMTASSTKCIAGDAGTYCYAVRA